MYAVRFGSYSIAATRAGTPSFWRLKSILRYRRFAPPPRWREVMRPCVLRPPDFLRPSVSAFSGSFFVTSARSDQVAKRRPGGGGLWRLTAISEIPNQSRTEEVPRAAGSDEGFLPHLLADLLA